MDTPRLVTVNGHTPVVHDDAWIAPGVVVAGNVEVRAGASIWFGCVLRAEVGPIVVGEESNLQDGTVVHADPDHPVTIGRRVTVGHRAVVHGCTLEDDVLVGMGAIVLNGAHVGAGAVVGAGALVTEGTSVAPRTVVVGAPARPRDLDVPPTPRPNVATYTRLAKWYRAATG
ncbi:gamma carbonic anhydrase family protein [Salsipaludibacter albus]|uniref:gamma carbonic anhydrase family protein n=1 Tax=Salsipaludibacter albus TaxID=2849650 RepID=UPI001EE4A97F|nr:gamma carbonic anhydrase family protein [Salsipaludibacter albus]MBY5163536.1 gamma carbonic anhydrase family protein [Salsipaludibacter albus]